MDLNTHILVVDDDPGIRELTGRFLEGHGFRVTLAENGPAMRAAMAIAQPDLIVLDVMMPGEDGLTILRTLDPATRPPVIMMSVIGTDVDRIIGLEMGADDYLPKPANPRELLARIRTVLRRRAPPPATRPERGADWTFEGWRMDPVARDLHDPDGANVSLTDGEFRLLLALVEHPRRVLTRDFLLEAMRGHDADQFDRAIDVQISRLRKRLAHDRTPDLIRTVRNEGYMFTAPVKRG
ncbi:response regulator [Sphingomonas sp. SUN039]|uniref:response regulator n=1 Tax=Sphingomonas sp. SUN039 TaxID=2937787 RepID=UPI002164C2BD|nr:response regulator [Sphingomonas sp. SUN039]UVO55807.1 response regulator [Sphingomonas sp. SUN039]